MEKLQRKIKTLPKKPGVYLFKDQKGRIIYIGKALSLKDRIKSYFRQLLADEKTRLLVSQIAGFDYQIVPSEFEALLLEAKLIKEYKPKYNSQLKDDKRHLYIGITKSPPRIFPFRRPELEKDLLDWFGPFPSARSVRQVLRILRRIFPYCSCRPPPKRQCLYFHINLCPGFENLSTKEYQADIQKIRRTLNGKTTFIIRNLEKKMNQAAKKLFFEKAQKYKQQVAYLKHVTQGWRPISEFEDTAPMALLKLRRLLVKYQGLSPTTLNKIEGYDVSNLGKDIIVGAMVAFVNGQPEKGLYRKFKIRLGSRPKHPRNGKLEQNNKTNPNYRTEVKLPWSRWENRQDKMTTASSDPASIEQIIFRRLNHPEWLYPQLILVDGGKPQVSAALEAIKEKDLAGQICILGLAKRKETIVVPKIKNQQIIGWKLLNYSPQNPALKLLQQIRDEAHRFAQKYYQHLHLKKSGLKS